MDRNPTLSLAMAALVAWTVGACSGQSEQALLAAGEAHLSKGDAKAAVIEFKNAIALNAESGASRALLGQALLASGDPTSAVVELRKARNLGAADERVVPPLARALLRLGEDANVLVEFGGVILVGQPLADLRSSMAAATIRSGNLVEALRHVQAALQAAPGYGPAQVLQARLMAIDGQIAEAISLLDSVLSSDPGNEDAGLLKGEILGQAERDLPAAIEAYRQVLASQPRSLQAGASLIELLYRSQRQDEARVQLAALVKQWPGHPQTLFAQAQVAYADGEYAQSREHLDRILRSLPDLAPALELAGAAEYALRNDLRAQDFLSRALKSAPGSVAARRLLAQSHLRSRQPDKAAETLQRVIEQPAADGLSLSIAAEALMQLGDAKRANDLFRRASQAAPDNVKVRTAAAMARLRQEGAVYATVTRELTAMAASDTGTQADMALISASLTNNDLPAALKAIEALRKKLPDHPLPSHLQGVALLIQRDLPGAEKALDAAMRLDTAYFPAVAARAGAEVMQGQRAQAMARLEAFGQAHPKNFRPWLALAELKQQAGTERAAVGELISRAVQADPTAMAPRIRLVDHFLATGASRQALQAAQAAAAAMPDQPEVQDALGRAQLAAGDTRQAVVTLTQLSALQPGNPLRQLRLGEAKLVLKDHSGAAAAFRRALELQPDLLAAHRARVMLAMVRKQPQDGLDAARQIQKLRPKDPMGYSLEGDVEVSRGDWAAAVAAYRAALQRGSVVDAAVKLLVALLSAWQAAAADRFASDWQRQNPADPTFLFYLGGVATARGRNDEAEQRYRQVLAVRPDHAAAMNNLAGALMRQGKPGALSLAEQANRLAPGNPALMDTWATALAANGRTQEALDTQRQALTLRPEDPALKLNLARLLIQANDKSSARDLLLDLSRLGAAFNAHAEVDSLLRSL